MKKPSILKKKSAPSPHDSSLLPKDRSSRMLDFVTDDTPQPGDVREIADGVFWLRFSLPMTGLNHINLYALRDGEAMMKNGQITDAYRQKYQNDAEAGKKK